MFKVKITKSLVLEKSFILLIIWKKKQAPAVSSQDTFTLTFPIETELCQVGLYD